ncbi:MAG: hypothetical protein L6R37_003897 [Teloschistes peruensis]|nr:MAG: hypothetical protein L6R37_003897 [Teloschistes peruensis]
MTRNLAMTADSEVDKVDLHGFRGSHSSDDQSVTKALEESGKRRRDVQRNKIEKDYYLEMERLEKSSIASLDDSVNKITAFYKTRLETLSALLIKKAEIEDEIVQSTAKLERALAGAKEELQTVLDARLAQARKDLGS